MQLYYNNKIKLESKDFICLLELKKKTPLLTLVKPHRNKS